MRSSLLYFRLDGSSLQSTSSANSDYSLGLINPVLLPIYPKGIPMYCYLDRSYCNSDANKCVRKSCTHHLENTDPKYNLSKNIQNIPIAMTDFHLNCEEYLPDES